MTGSQITRTEETTDYDGLTIRFDDRVLRPRPWTAAQSRWAAALLEAIPPGPVLELCAGAAQIGLTAIVRSRRRLVCVDADSAAAQFAIINARAAGMADRVEVRTADIGDAVASGEEFALVIADPPWVRRSHTRRYPEDPLTAIDGGPDGLDVARECVHVIGLHLVPEGMALVQLGSAEQVESLSPEIERAGLNTLEVRCYDGGVVTRLGRQARRVTPGQGSRVQILSARRIVLAGQRHVVRGVRRARRQDDC
jgi:release factor glutamine methyltransferase